MHTFFNAYGTNKKNSHKMTIQNATSNKTLKRAYVRPSLEIFISEEENCLLIATVTTNNPHESGGDGGGEGENEEMPAKQGFFNPNMFTDEDFEDY